MINAMSPPILWPALMRWQRRLRQSLAQRRQERRRLGDIGQLSDRMLRDIVLPEHARSNRIQDAPCGRV